MAFGFQACEKLIDGVHGGSRLWYNPFVEIANGDSHANH